MKLISCHIENFGKLHNCSTTFQAGANIVCKENGWGKSTFAAFIRAMFYGLDGERKRSIKENERKRYAPWQGGVFGGKLVFEVQGKSYEISRIFKDKERNDEFELRDAGTNLISRDYSENIGEELFQINRESFLNTVFIGQGSCETSATDDINAKMENVADSTSDLNCFETAAKRLDSILNRMTPHHSKGSISKREKDIAECERIVRDGQEIDASIRRVQHLLHEEENTYDELNIQIKKAGELQTRVAQMQSASTKKNEWERLKKECLKKKNEFHFIREQFPGTMPDDMEIKEKIGECGQMEKAGERVNLYRLTDTEKAEYKRYSDDFENGIPEEQEIAGKIAKEARLRTLVQELSSEQITPAEIKRLEELEPFFANEKESPARIAARWSERSSKKAAEPSRQAALAALKASTGVSENSGQTGTGNKGLPFLIAGILLLIAGGIIMAGISAVIGGILAAVGAVSLVCGLAAGRKPPNKNGTSTSEPLSELTNLQQTIEEDAVFIRETDDTVREYLAAHGRAFDETMVSSYLQEIIAEAHEYDTLAKKAVLSGSSEKTAEREQISLNISSFLEQYGFSSSETSFADDLHRLKDRVSKFLSLQEKYTNGNQAEQEYNTYKDRITEFLNTYPVSDDIRQQKGIVYTGNKDMMWFLNELRETVITCKSREQAYQQAKADLEKFEEENDTSALADTKTSDELEKLPSLEDINEKILELSQTKEETHEKILSYNKQLEDLQERHDEWEETRTHLEELKELQTEERRKYEHICLAKAKLELAKETMTAKYSEPILNGFSKYFEMLTGETADTFHIDAHTVLTVDECGKQRQIDTLSSGYQDLAGICLRLALIDAMYREESPVLVMDDPFANLDDAKTAAGIHFLEKVAEQYQILYFTCSRSRK